MPWMPYTCVIILDLLWVQLWLVHQNTAGDSPSTAWHIMSTSSMSYMNKNLAVLDPQHQHNMHAGACHPQVLQLCLHCARWTRIHPSVWSYLPHRVSSGKYPEHFIPRVAWMPGLRHWEQQNSNQLSRHALSCGETQAGPDAEATRAHSKPRRAASKTHWLHQPSMHGEPKFLPATLCHSPDVLLSVSSGQSQHALQCCTICTESDAGWYEGKNNQINYTAHKTLASICDFWRVKAHIYLICFNQRQAWCVLGVEGHCQIKSNH